MPDPNPNPQGSQAGQSPQAQPGAQLPVVKPIEEFVKKKGVKDINDIPKMYEDTEASFHREKQKLQTAKTEVEQQSQGQLTLDDNGKVIQNPGFQGVSYGQPQQPGYGQPNQQGQPGYQQEVVYDPYTGQPLTDPVAIQLSRMPLGAREVMITNAILEQREKQQQLSYSNDHEILNSPEAKGFETDVRNIMNALPLPMRADKKQWQDALLRVKGLQFDKMRQSAGQEGVENFLNKLNIQSLPETPGQGGTRLSPDQQKQWDWYQTNQPEVFKGDVNKFLKRVSSNKG
jgi:hypothetical protein